MRVDRTIDRAHRDFRDRGLDLLDLLVVEQLARNAAGAQSLDAFAAAARSFLAVERIDAAGCIEIERRTDLLLGLLVECQARLRDVDIALRNARRRIAVDADRDAAECR